MTVIYSYLENGNLLQSVRMRDYPSRPTDYNTSLFLTILTFFLISILIAWSPHWHWNHQCIDYFTVAILCKRAHISL